MPSFFPPMNDAIEREQVDSVIGPTSNSVPYVEASFSIPVGTTIAETPLHLRTEILVRVVEIEAPVHREEVARRMLSLWGQGRLGSRIADAIELSCRTAIGQGMITEDGDGYLSHPQKARTVVVRDRSNVGSTSLRKPEFLPPTEVRQAVREIVTREIGISPDEVSVAVTRLLGFTNVTAALRETASRGMNHLLESGEIVNRSGRLFVSDVDQL
jgi:hypothetical protein